MPVSLELSIPSTHQIGTEVGRALLPMGNEIITQLRRIDENIQYYTDLFRPLPDQLGTAVTDGIQTISIRVFETNQTLLDHIEAARWAIAYLAYNTMADVWNLLVAMHARGGQILEGVRGLRGDVAAFGAEVTMIGAYICALLEAILDQLRAGVNLIGRIDIVITGGGSGGPFDFLKDLDLWKLLAFLAILAGFVAALGLAMDLFTTNALIAATAIAVFVAAIIPLLDKLAGFDWPTLGKIGLGLAALAGFVAALGYALRPLTKETAEAIPALNSLIKELGDLAVKLGALSVGSALVMAGALTALAGFVYALASALSKLDAETLKALGPLSEFVDHLGNLAVKLAALSVGSALVMAGALTALAGFVYALATAISKLDADTVKALGPLSEFIDHLGAFAVTLAKLSLGQVLSLGGSLLALGLFVNALASSLATLSADTLKALGPLSQFIDHLGTFAVTLAKFSLAQVLALGESLLALGLFVSSLASSLATLNADTLKALGPFSDFIDHLGELAVKLAAFSLGDVVALGASLLFLALFVSSLASSLSGMSVDLLNALPSFTALIEALQSLATALASMSIGELVAMGVGFALIAGFVWALAAALVYAEGPLKSIASILENTRGILEDIGKYGDKLLEFLGGLAGEGEAAGGGLLEGILGGLGGGLLDLAPEILPFLLASNGPGPAAPGTPPGGGTMVAAGALPTSGLLPGPAGIPGPAGALAATPGGAGVTVQGGITVNINADKLEADASRMLSDEIVQALSTRLQALQGDANRRLGVAAVA